MKKYLLLALVAVAAIAYSCTQKVKPTPNPTPDPKGKKLKFESLQKGSYSGFERPQETVIKDQSTLTQAWTQAYKGQDPKPKPSKIDFNEKMVLLVAMGSRNSGGFSIEIAEIKLDNAAVVVLVEEKEPSGMATMALTQPYHMVVLEKRAEKVLFKRK